MTAGHRSGDERAPERWLPGGPRGGVLVEVT